MWKIHSKLNEKCFKLIFTINPDLFSYVHWLWNAIQENGEKVVVYKIQNTAKNPN